uniref:Uncharacterized protein n=1 Tax=Rhizophora mucronata TaxID=61149 RepID=A0A2P2QZI2_RHIMU
MREARFFFSVLHFRRHCAWQDNQMLHQISGNCA